MIPLLGGALLAGAAGSPHCVGMCGGFATAAGPAWHLGRLGTYAVLGGLAGVVGRTLPGPGWLGTALAVVLLVVFAARLAGLVKVEGLAIPGLAGLAARVARQPGFLSRVAFGALTGLLPCGLVWTALAMAVAAGGALWGALTMVVFGLGTVPALALATVAVRRLNAPRLVAAAVLALGIASIAMRSELHFVGDGELCHPSPGQ